MYNARAKVFLGAKFQHFFHRSTSRIDHHSKLRIAWKKTNMIKAMINLVFRHVY